MTSRLARDRRAVVALEFAVVAPFVVFLLLAIIEVAVLGWTQVVLQFTAGQTARCVAIGSTACTDPQQFAVNLANEWLFPDAVAANGVSVTASASCSTAPGVYTKVTVTAQFAGTTPLPGILGGGALSAQSCFFNPT